MAANTVLTDSKEEYRRKLFLGDNGGLSKISDALVMHVLVRTIIDTMQQIIQNIQMPLFNRAVIPSSSILR